MNEHSHRGARAPGLVRPPSDRRLLELDEALRGVEAVSDALPNLGLLRDSGRAVGTKQRALNRPGIFTRGVVINATPSLNWYKVQVGEGVGTIAASMLTCGTMTPFGPRPIGMARPNDNVLIFKPPGLDHGFIIGVMPPYAAENSILVPDSLFQGAGTGLRRESARKFPLKSLYKAGGMIDWSAQRPQDQTSLEQGFASPFGVTLSLDDFSAQFRVNEMCGLWLSSVDDWLRLAGNSLLVESAIHEIDACDDEGEARFFHGIAAYPHEALGQYASGQKLTQTYADKDVQYSLHRGKEDLKQGEEDITPFYRYQEYGGYLGQGHLRFVAGNEKTEGVRLHSRAESEPDSGLFMESIGLEGEYTLLSAKGVHIGKRARIVVPRQKQPQASALGDDAKEDNYKFSSLHGSGDEHKIGELAFEGDVGSILRPAAVLELTAYAANWRALHPFHYHTADFSTPQAAAGKPFNRTQAHLSLGGDQFYVEDPEPVMLNIDPRYGEVSYYERESAFRMNDDGGIHLLGGAGEEIIMAGGRIRLNAPKGIDLCPGTELTVHAAQVIVKAKNSIDLSSTEKDVRIKAAKNIQVVSTEGGILIESQSDTDIYKFKDVYGEDVESCGVIIKAATSRVGVLGKDIYIRNGGELGNGEIVIDAGKGERNVTVYAKEFRTFAGDLVAFSYGPNNEDSTVNSVYQFRRSSMLADVNMNLGGKLLAYSGSGGAAGIVVDGGISSTGAIVTSGTVSDSRGSMLGKTPETFADTITSQCATVSDSIEGIKTDEEEVHRSTIVETFYRDEQIGNDEVLRALSFSFRDPPTGTAQYKTDDFQFAESHWQQLERLGLADGGVPWTEKPVTCQGRETYPWPGKQKWVEEPTFLRLETLQLFSVGDGVDQARPGPYEDPDPIKAEKVTPQQEYKLTQQ